jgi:hypothetical protein
MIDVQRRHFMRRSSALSGAFSGALLSAFAPGLAKADNKPRLWRAAEVLVGQSTADQAPSPQITCPLYFPNGNAARASHSLDLAAVPVRGDMTWDGDTIVPDFGPSIAVAANYGSDGSAYLLVGGEGAVTGASGNFAGVSRVIVRCKYKVMTPQQPLLIACVYCVVVLVQG